MKVKSCFAALGIVLAFASTSHATKFSFGRPAITPEYVSDAARVDILGIKPGMKAKEVKAVIRLHFPGEKIEEASAAFGSGENQTRRYRSGLTVSKTTKSSKDTISVEFGSPGIGSEATLVTRSSELNYKRQRPTIDAMVAQMTKEFGTPATVDKTRNAVSLEWHYGSGSCKRISNLHPYEFYSPLQGKDYMKEAKSGCDVIVKASIRATPFANDGRARFVDVAVYDIKRRAINAKVDARLLKVMQDN
ncbi:hypothetical protein [Mesorhizobium sp. SP-1A]|uniref:hypothetical protein n=1 Tax=Mesorhizobium sp. SP-1A TaxID=3077840 RepID=UPI0028F70A5C|nr:hypothetical protein [Mesorhizobium sp. SP-1A]